MATPELANVKFEPKNSLGPRLIEYETKMQSSSYKFGIIYAKDSNQTEQEMFSNGFSFLFFFLFFSFP